MNFSFILGSIIFWSIIFYAMTSSAGLAAFINMVAVAIVLFGTISTIVMSYSFIELKSIMQGFLISIRRPSYSNITIIERINLYSGIIKKDGILEVQEEHAEEENQFLKEVMQNLIDNVSVEDISMKYNTYLDYMEDRHNRIITAYDNMGGVAGAMGMIGTLIGLVAMLLKMDDPAAIGPAMAVALLTTFYGALIGNGFTNSVATTLKNIHAEEELQKRIILKGVILIGENVAPKLIREILVSMIPKNEAEKLEF